MILIKLLPPALGEETEFAQGQTIDGWDSVLWVERYNKPGEFKIEAPFSSGLKYILPINSFITHVETTEVMFVENHEIIQPEDEDSRIIITGSSFTAWLANRVIGESEVTPVNLVSPYTIASGKSWDQIETLIHTHIVDSFDANNEIAGWEVDNTCTGTPTEEAREIDFGTVLERVLELLKVDDIGIKTVRPTPSDSTSYWRLYQGQDKSSSVRFSWLNGDLTSLNYFFTSKNKFTYAKVMGRWIQLRVGIGVTSGFDRKTLLVDASHIDQEYSSPPGGGDLTAVVNAMNVWGRMQLAKRNNISITQADVSEDTPIKYRTDYNIGDLVSVDGDFGATTVFRVVEFAEVVDENGARGHPTLAVPGED